MRHLDERPAYLAEPRFVENPLLKITLVLPISWCERLFSWPWRPWVRTRTITAPDPNLMFDATKFTYYGHPVTLKAFRDACASKVELRNS